MLRDDKSIRRIAAALREALRYFEFSDFEELTRIVANRGIADKVAEWQGRCDLKYQELMTGYGIAGGGTVAALIATISVPLLAATVTTPLHVLGITVAPHVLMIGSGSAFGLLSLVLAERWNHLHGEARLLRNKRSAGTEVLGELEVLRDLLK